MQEEEYGLDDHLIKILILIAEMDDHLRRLGFKETRNEDCKRFKICQLMSLKQQRTLTPEFGVEHLHIADNLLGLLEKGRWVPIY